jgi:transposase
MASSRPKPWIVDDELWGLIEPLLPQAPRRFRYPGRKRLDDRLVLQGILFVLHTGIGFRAPATTAGIRLGHDRLAQAACLAGRRGVGSAACAAAGASAHRG